jgi:hypothetical protein
MEKCSAGPLPTLVEDSDDEEDLPILIGDTESEQGDEDSDAGFEEGDHLFATGLGQPPAEIRATSSISQRLAEAFKRNTVLERSEESPTDLRSGVPDYLQEFDDVFSKESFEMLPESKPWDHAIELVPGEKVTGGFKVYPLSPLNRKSWMHSFRKTWNWDASDPQNCLWHHRSSSSKRNVEDSDLCRTIEPSMR